MAKSRTRDRVAVHVLTSSFARVAGDRRCKLCRQWLNAHSADVSPVHADFVAVQRARLHKR